MKWSPAPFMPRTVLIVDDNAPFRGMLKSMLKMRGFEAIVASSAAEALRLPDNVQIDAAIADYDMPGVNGVEFCRVFRERNKAKGRDVPMWVMTGALHPRVSEGAESVGAVLLLRKPFNFDELAAMMEREIQKREIPPKT